ncbi:hypothetical protein [Calidifontibacter indicus]|uniref:hypothetical protein n=1 Tax=Calidifontibacter indicus TaxID=419650 RepID=UPI003D721688
MSGDVAVSDIEQVGLDSLALVRAVQDRQGAARDYSVRLGVTPATQIFRRSDPFSHGRFLIFDDNDRVASYPAIDATIIGTAGRENLVRSCADLIEDAVHQAGTTTPNTGDALMTMILVD